MITVVLYAAETATASVYTELPADVEGAIMHVLSGTEPTAMQSPTTVEIMGQVPGHARDTGACLCTSFSQNVVNNTCLGCGHEVHNTRVHCGALK